MISAAARHSPPSRPPRSGGPASCAQRGFSVIEALIASAILLIIALGLLPMFTQSISNNLQGRQASEATNEARSHIEQLFQLPFDSPQLTIPVGEVELETEEYLPAGTEQWEPAASFDPDDGYLFRRIVTVRQYTQDALEDGKLELGEAIAGDAATQVHFKEVIVQVESAAGIGSPPKRLTLRTIKTV